MPRFIVAERKEAEEESSSEKEQSEEEEACGKQEGQQDAAGAVTAPARLLLYIVRARARTQMQVTLVRATCQGTDAMQRDGVCVLCVSTLCYVKC